MAWDDAPPTAQEMKAAPSADGWDSAPPTEQELKETRGQQMLRGFDEDLHKTFSPENIKKMGMAQSGMMIPAALAANSPLLRSLWTRFGTNTALGAVGGGARDADSGMDRAKNAALGGAIGGAASLGGEALAKAIPFVGGKLAHVSPDNAQAYADNPELAEKLYGQFQQDPEALNQTLRGQIRGDLNQIFENKSQPLLDARGGLLTGKNVRIDPKQFAGTAGEAELARIAALTPGSNQTSGPMNLTGAQAQRLKSLLQEAADYSSTSAKLNPVEYAAKSEGDALAAANARRSIEGVAPGVRVLNAELGRNARMGEAAKSVFNSNPSRILNNSESIGNTNVRSIQNFLDENAGSNFGEMADAFAAGKAMHHPSSLSNMIERITTDPAGRLLLRQSGNATSALQSPVAPQTIAEVLTSLLASPSQRQEEPGQKVLGAVNRRLSQQSR